MNFKNILALFFLLSSIALTGCISHISQDELAAQRQTMESYTIEASDLIMTENYIAYVDSDQNTKISAKIAGRVEKIYVDEGDKINMGDVIAKLDTAESEINYKSSENILQALQQSYQDTQAMFDSQIEALQEKVKQVKISRELSEIADKDGIGIAGRKITQSKLAAETKKLELEHNITILKQQGEQLYSNALNAIGQAKILMDNIGEFSDKLLGITDINKHENYAFKQYIGAKDILHTSETEKQRLKLKLDYKNLELDQLTSISNKTLIYDKLSDIEEFLYKTKDFLEELNKVLDDSVSGVSLTTATIANYKAKITTFMQNIESTLLTAQGSYLLGIKGSRQAIENFNNQSEMQIDLLTKQQELIGQQFEVDKESLLQSNNISEQQYNEVLANLNALRKQKDAQLSQIRSQIEQTKGQTSLANQNIDNAYVYAPYDGTIIKKYTELGQIIGPGTIMFEFSNTSKIVLKIAVSELLARNLQVGQTGTAYFDSLDKEYIVKISKIAVSSDLLSKKRSIELVPIEYEDDLSIGMYAKIYLNKQILSSSVIPNDFIEYQYGNAYIYKVENNSGSKYIKTPIEIKECSDDFCNIQGDINIGDIIVKK